MKTHARQRRKRCRYPSPTARQRCAPAAGRGAAVDALVVAFAEWHEATVLTSEPGDLGALADVADGVHIEPTW